jgi:uncharacterized protein (DUF983 family)
MPAMAMREEIHFASDPQPAAREEMDSHGEWNVAGPRQAAKYIGRALLLHCPHCGGGPVLRNWFKPLDRCGACGLRVERGEHDYVSGSILLSYSVGTLVFAIALAWMIVASWPTVPWDLLQIVLPAIIVLFPVAFFPFSKLLWLAADLIMRPVSAKELEWHRAATEKWSTERAAPDKER